MAQLPLPTAKQEYHDGVQWFTTATENWVLNTIRTVLPCLVATTANLNGTYANGTAGVGATLTNAGTQAALAVDGVNVVVGDRVLVKNQNFGSQSGIYVVVNSGSVSTNWILRRSSDYDSIEQMQRGDVITVIRGATQSASLWMLQAGVTAIGTDSVLFIPIDRNSFTSILGTTNQIAVSVFDGVATISLVPNPVLPGTASVTIPTGTTAQRPTTGTLGMIRINTDL